MHRIIDIDIPACHHSRHDSHAPRCLLWRFALNVFEGDSDEEIKMMYQQGLFLYIYYRINF